MPFQLSSFSSTSSSSRKHIPNILICQPLLFIADDIGSHFKVRAFRSLRSRGPIVLLRMWVLMEPMRVWFTAEDYEEGRCNHLKISFIVGSGEYNWFLIRSSSSKGRFVKLHVLWKFAFLSRFLDVFEIFLETNVGLRFPFSGIRVAVVDARVGWWVRRDRVGRILSLRERRRGHCRLSAVLDWLSFNWMWHVEWKVSNQKRHVVARGERTFSAAHSRLHEEVVMQLRNLIDNALADADKCWLLVELLNDNRHKFFVHNV